MSTQAPDWEVRTIPWGSDEIIDLLGELFGEVWPGRAWEPNLEAYAALPLHISGLFEAAAGGSLVGLAMFLVCPDLNLGCEVGSQVALYVRPGPRRGWGYVKLLRHVQETLAARGVAMLGGVAKAPPLGDLGPVFRRLGWTRDEVVYRWEAAAQARQPNSAGEG